MNWEDELKKKHFREEYECTHPDTRPIYIFKQKMDELIADISSLLKKERIDENKKWMIKSCQEGHDFEGYCEGDFLNRISEVEGGTNELGR